mgnify:CR=1 FL=1
MTFDLVTTVKNVFCVADRDNVTQNSRNVFLSYSVEVLKPILTKRGQNDRLACPHRSYDFDPHLTFNLVTGVKYVI